MRFVVLYATTNFREEVGTAGLLSLFKQESVWRVGSCGRRGLWFTGLWVVIAEMFTGLWVVSCKLMGVALIL